jgi:hypothetical protein
MANFDPLVDNDPPNSTTNPSKELSPGQKDEPLTDTLKGGPRAPLEPEAAKETSAASDEEPDPVANEAPAVSRNLNVYYGMPAGPPPHPRTV